MFVGSTSGNRFSGVLPTDGDYAIRVYLMRNAARRNESARLHADRRRQRPGAGGDAGGRGRADSRARLSMPRRRSSARCRSRRMIKECDAFVIRRGFDGTATVEVRWGEGLKRRILFVKGKAVAADATDALVGSNAGAMSASSTSVATNASRFPTRWSPAAEICPESGVDRDRPGFAGQALAWTATFATRPGAMISDTLASTHPPNTLACKDC